MAVEGPVLETRISVLVEFGVTASLTVWSYILNVRFYAVKSLSYILIVCCYVAKIFGLYSYCLLLCC